MRECSGPNSKKPNTESRSHSGKTLRMLNVQVCTGDGCIVTSSIFRGRAGARSSKQFVFSNDRKVLNISSAKKRIPPSSWRGPS